MKVSIITRHAISNYGSLLQAYATQTVIEKLGYEAEIIDYIREDEKYKNISRSQLSQNERWNRNIFTKAIYLLLQSPEYIESGKKFEKIRRKYLKLSRQYTTIDELKADPPLSDIYCTGSDQVWGPVGTDQYDPSYFLDFIPPSKKKIAYAASFGRTNFNPITIAIYKQMLASYDFISVRENSALNVLQQMGIATGEQVLDPTLLISEDEWSRLLGDKIIKKEPYVLLYTLGNNPKIDKFAYAFSKRKGLPLIRITATRHWRTKNAENILLPDLNEFVSYIRHAAFMITNSFHGTAFALNCRTQFVNILPGVTSTRNESILSLVGLKNRIITDFSDDSILDETIDFSTVHEILNDEKKKSFDCLLRMLE